MKKRILIEGMSCGHCVAHVRKALENIDGITNVSVDLDSGSAVVETDRIENHVISNAVENAGYTALSIEDV